MLPLPELQRRLGSVLTGHEAELPVRGNGLSVTERLQVYRNNMRINLTEALRSVYPVCERLVGEEFFAVAAGSYMEAHPSQSGDIQDYGGAFPRFLAGYGPAASVPYLGDVAELEWRRLEASRAMPHTPLDTTALARVDRGLHPGLRFRLAPAVGVFRSSYPALTIWEYCQAASPEVGLDIDRPGECVLIARSRLDVYMRRLSPGEYAFLQRLSCGETFEVACREALEAESGFDVAHVFVELVRDEILTEFRHDTQSV